MLSPLLLAHGLAVRGAAAATTVGETFVVPQPGGKGCTAEVMGCYYDKKWDDCRFATEPIKADCTQSAKYRCAAPPAATAFLRSPLPLTGAT